MRRRCFVGLVLALAGWPSVLHSEPSIFYRLAIESEKNGDILQANRNLDSAIRDSLNILGREAPVGSEAARIYALIRHDEKWNESFSPGRKRPNLTADLNVRKSYFYELLNAIIAREKRRQEEAEQQDRDTRSIIAEELRAIREILSGRR